MYEDDKIIITAGRYAHCVSGNQTLIRELADETIKRNRRRVVRIGKFLRPLKKVDFKKFRKFINWILKLYSHAHLK